MENGKNYGFFKNVSLICCRFPVQADVNYPCPPAGGGRRGGPQAAAGRAGVNHMRGGCGMVGVRGGGLVVTRNHVYYIYVSASLVSWYACTQEGRMEGGAGRPKLPLRGECVILLSSSGRISIKNFIA